MIYKFKYLTIIVMALSLLSALLIVTACDNAQSRAKNIISLRSERKEVLDKLYREYGGSEISQSIKSGLQKGGTSGDGAQNQIAHGLANLTQGADRSIFEQSVRTVGSGENLIVVSDKAKQFFSRPHVLKKGKRICEIDVELDQLERKEN